jgi:hypothetical protein
MPPPPDRAWAMPVIATAMSGNTNAKRRHEVKKCRRMAATWSLRRYITVSKTVSKHCMGYRHIATSQVAMLAPRVWEVSANSLADAANGA